MKKFINDPYDVVDEMLEGFLDVHKKYVRKLEAARTVVRADAPVEGKVGVITGGGSGHKPAFIGFIGQGMLDAVAVGEIFTSPPPLACFEAAKAADGGKGVLFLLGNYAGDVMNFQLAADMAKAAGIPVEQVISTDDVGSGPREEADKRRGVVGAFLAGKWPVPGLPPAAALKNARPWSKRSTPTPAHWVLPYLLARCPPKAHPPLPLPKTKWNTP